MRICVADIASSFEVIFQILPRSGGADIFHNTAKFSFATRWVAPTGATAAPAAIIEAPTSIIPATTSTVVVSSASSASITATPAAIAAITIPITTVAGEFYSNS